MTNSQLQDTIFYKIIKKEAPANILYEDEDVLVILDLFPVATGHSLVIPKQPSKNLLDIDEKSYLTLMNKTRLLGKQIIKKLNVDGYRMTVHSGKSAGQDIFYTHAHIIPTDSDFENRKNWNYLIKKLKIETI